MKFATAKNLNLIWRALKSLVTASEERLRALEHILSCEEMAGDLLTVTDSEGHILGSVDKGGTTHLPLGVVSGEAEVTGALKVGKSRLLETEDDGLFNITDEAGLVVLHIDHSGNVDFEGVPHDVLSELSEIKSRLDALEAASPLTFDEQADAVLPAASLSGHSGGFAAHLTTNRLDAVLPAASLSGHSTENREGELPEEAECGDTL